MAPTVTPCRHHISRNELEDMSTVRDESIVKGNHTPKPRREPMCLFQKGTGTCHIPHAKEKGAIGEATHREGDYRLF